MNPTLEQMVQHIYNELPAIIDAVKQIPQILTSIQALEQGQAAFRQELNDFKTEVRRELAEVKHDLAEMKHDLVTVKQQIAELQAAQFAIINEQAAFRHELSEMRREFRLELDLFRQQTARNAECHTMLEVTREQVSMHHSTFHAIQKTLDNQLQRKTV